MPYLSQIKLNFFLCTRNTPHSRPLLPHQALRQVFFGSLVPDGRTQTTTKFTSPAEDSDIDCKGEGESQIFDGVSEVSQTLTPVRTNPKMEREPDFFGPVHTP